MLAVRTAIFACLVLTACDGNPFIGQPATPEATGEKSVSTLPGTVNPSSRSSISRSEARDLGPNGIKVDGNGYAEGYSYDGKNDTFTVDNLAFDGGNTYARSTTIPSVGPAGVYEASSTYADSQTGAQIDQLSYRALFGVSKTGRTNFAIVRTGSYIPYGFGGFLFNRAGDVTLPTSGQAEYRGTYAGLRDFDGDGGLQITSADMRVAIDFNDFNPDEGLAGKAAYGIIDNRKIFDLDGNDITATVLAGINADKTPDFALTELPTVLFKIGPGNVDLNGELEGELSDYITANGKNETFEDGKYYAVLSGKNADELAGIIVITSDINGTTARETGGFILYRP